jgi:glucose/arabinose dehydrogenase
MSLGQMLRQHGRPFQAALLGGLLGACSGGGDPAGATGPGLALARVASGLSEPVFLAAPAGDARQFIVERAGRILVMEEGTLQPRPFLDIRARIDPGVDGLMSMAFDPGYAGNGYFYVYRTDLERNMVIERYTVSADRNLADPASADSPQHFGGQVAFGPDGYLYAATGDGGVPNDAPGNARNLDSLLGKMLRLDVGAASAAAPYRIPASNPYLGQPGRRPEIWASGLRNPWRFSFDGDSLYIADIGQDAVEEVDLVSASQAGLDYGWNRMEGGSCFLTQACDRGGITLPVVEYAHGTAPDSPCSITGGYVYRGTAIPELAGHYFYSDFCAGFLRSFHADGATIRERRDWPVERPGQVTSFGRDGSGELYLVTLGGEIWKIVKPAR